MPRGFEKYRKSAVDGKHIEIIASGMGRSTIITNPQTQLFFYL